MIHGQVSRRDAVIPPSGSGVSTGSALFAGYSPKRFIWCHVTGSYTVWDANGRQSSCPLSMNSGNIYFFPNTKIADVTGSQLGDGVVSIY